MRGIKKYPTDSELREFLEIQAQIKELEIRLNHLKQLCKDCGAFATKKYVVAVVVQQQERLAGLKEVVGCFGRKQLEMAGLINHIEFSVVKISPIGFKLETASN